MNNQLKNDVYQVPINILNNISKTLQALNGRWDYGVERAKNLLNNKKVTYTGLKRIIHDLKNIDKVNKKTQYELYGGDLMLNWATSFLNANRKNVKDDKTSSMNINNNTGLNGVRKNSFLKKHTKKSSNKIPSNFMKSNSEKTSVSNINVNNIFEEIKRIKDIINY